MHPPRLQTATSGTAATMNTGRGFRGAPVQAGGALAAEHASRGAKCGQRGHGRQQAQGDAGVGGVHVEGHDGVAAVVAELAQQRACAGNGFKLRGAAAQERCAISSMAQAGLLLHLRPGINTALSFSES